MLSPVRPLPIVAVSQQAPRGSILTHIASGRAWPHIAVAVHLAYPGKADVEAATVKPKEDGCCSRCLSCLGNTCINTLATSGLLIEKLLMIGSLLAFIDDMLVEEALATIGLLVVVSGAFVEEALASRCLVVGAFFHPHGIPGTLPKHVLFLCVPLT